VVGQKDMSHTCDHNVVNGIAGGLVTHRHMPPLVLTRVFHPSAWQSPLSIVAIGKVIGIF